VRGGNIDSNKGRSAFCTKELNETTKDNVCTKSSPKQEKYDHAQYRWFIKWAIAVETKKMLKKQEKKSWWMEGVVLELHPFQVIDPSSILQHNRHHLKHLRRLNHFLLPQHSSSVMQLKRR
jgi:hypothetical protein